MLLSEMFGVEREVEFEVIGYIGRFILRERSDGTERLLWRLKDNKVYVNADLDILYDIIFKAPSGIIHLPPPLTDEQKTVLMALYTLGARWIAKDETELMWAYKEKPLRGYNVWCAKPSMSGHMKIFDDAPVSLLVSWSDPEPFDIGKALGIKN